MLESLLARPFALVGSGLLAGLAVLTVHPTWAQAIGADVWNLPALNEQIRTEEAEDDRLADADETVRQRIAIKEAIVADLIAGRCTLAAATDQFTELNAARPEYLTVLRTEFAGETDREKFARNVIAFTLPRVAAPERAALRARLDAELRRMLAGSTN